MKDKKQKKQKCSLCEISQDTLEELKQENQKISLNKPDEKKRKFWKKILVLITLLVLAGFAFSSFFSNFYSPFLSSKEEGKATLLESSKVVKIGSLAPDFTSEDVYGNKISLSDFQDKKPVLLVFWATWCSYCRKELPDLKIFTAKYKNDIQVITVDSGESKQVIEDYIKEKNVNFLMLLDEKREIWNQYLVRGTPSHFLINKKGEIITLRVGLASINDLEVILTMLE